MQQLGLQAGPGALSDNLQQVFGPFEERLAAIERVLNVRIGSLERRLDQHMLQRADTNPAHHQARALGSPDVPDAQAAVPYIHQIPGGGANARAHFKIPYVVRVLLKRGLLTLGIHLVVCLTPTQGFKAQMPLHLQSALMCRCAGAGGADMAAPARHTIQVSCGSAFCHNDPACHSSQHHYGHGHYFLL